MRDDWAATDGFACRTVGILGRPEKAYRNSGAVAREHEAIEEVTEDHLTVAIGVGVTRETAAQIVRAGCRDRAHDNLRERDRIPRKLLCGHVSDGGFCAEPVV